MNTDVSISGSCTSQSYDANSNRTSFYEGANSSTYTIQSTSNRVTSISGYDAKTYSYDAAGNITGDGTHTYGYDDRGRLTDVDSGAVTYEHNGLGQRVLKDNGSETLFAYNEVGQLVGDSLGSLLKETVYFGGGLVAILESANRYDVHADHLGTPRVITLSGTAIWRWESDPFGTTAPDEDPDGDLTQFTYNVRFPGQYFDTETGFHYNYFRTYDPSTGRYLESDPIGLGGGLNTYGYVNANPLSYTDPTGEIAFIPILVGFAIGYAFDYALEKYKESNCSCEDTETPLGPAGKAGLGAAAGFFGPFDKKHRTGFAGGGPSGSATSGFSRLNHAAAESGRYSTKTRNLVT